MRQFSSDADSHLFSEASSNSDAADNSEKDRQVLEKKQDLASTKSSKLDMAGATLTGHASEIIGIFPLDKSTQDNFLSVAKDGSVLLWDLKSGRAKEIYPPGDALEAADYNPEKQLLALGLEVEVNVLNVSTGVTEHHLGKLDTKIAAIEFQPNSDAVVIGGVDGRVYRWKYLLNPDQSTKGRVPVERYLGHPSSVAALANHPLSKVFFSGDSFGTISAWVPYDKDLQEGQYDTPRFTGIIYTDIVTRSETSRDDHTSITALRASPDGRFLAVGYMDGKIEWRLIRGFRPVISTQAHDGLVFDLQFDRDSTHLISVSRDGYVRRWNLHELNDPGVLPNGMKKAPKYNEFKTDSLGYVTKAGEIYLPDVRKLVVMPNGKMIAGGVSGHLLELTQIREETDSSNDTK